MCGTCDVLEHSTRVLYLWYASIALVYLVQLGPQNHGVAPTVRWWCPGNSSESISQLGPFHSFPRSSAYSLPLSVTLSSSQSAWSRLLVFLNEEFKGQNELTSLSASNERNN